MKWKTQNIIPKSLNKQKYREMFQRLWIPANNKYINWKYFILPTRQTSFQNSEPRYSGRKEHDVCGEKRMAENMHKRLQET